MTFEYLIYIVVFGMAAVAIVLGTKSFIAGVLFHRYVTAALRDERSGAEESERDRFQPNVVVILPCCGVDERLEQTVASLRNQRYGPYEVIFAFESAADPAYEAIERWTRDWDRPGKRRVVAGRAEGRSQKIHNLLAAIRELPAESEVIVFLDSDAVPAHDWLEHLVSPLRDPAVGAATGFRWYATTGGLADGMRSAWNAAGITILHDSRTAFCWGGSTAVRRAEFESLRIAERWAGALSDDYVLTRAMRDAGRPIRFVPRAIIPSHDRTTARQFLTFARRQLIITRICAPDIWRSGFLLSSAMLNGGTATFLLAAACYAGWIGNRVVMGLASAAWLIILLLAAGKGLVRQLAVRRVLRYPDVSWRDVVWDVFGNSAIGGLHFWLMIASMFSRRFVWRHTIYEMISPEETRVIGRVGPPGASPAPST